MMGGTSFARFTNTADPLSILSFGAMRRTTVTTISLADRFPTFWYVRDTAYLEDRAKYQTFLRPAEMKRAYGMVQNYLRQMGKRTICRETGKAGPWVLPGALNAFRQGTWLRIGDWHFEPKTSR
jgi:hypothetical protein